MEQKMKTGEFKAGDLDLTYGEDGAAYLPDVDYIFGLTIDKNDNVYAAGRTLDQKYYVARITPDGRLDCSFGGDGFVIGAFIDNHNSQALTVNIDHQDRILISGNGSGDWVGLARFKLNGELDETFGEKGKKIIPPPLSSEHPTTEPPQTDHATSQSSAMTVLNDGKIVLFMRFWNGTPYLIRLEENGKLDETFNGDGYVEVIYKEKEIYPSARGVIQGERLIVGAAVRDDPLMFGLLAAYDLNGELDQTFAKDGYALLEEPADSGSEVWGLQQGKGHQIWAIGRTTPPPMGSDLPPTRGFLTRFTKDGHLDTTCNGGNPILTPAGLDDEWIAGAIQDDEKIVLSGSRFAAGVGMLGRYNPDGSQDAGFGENGISFLPSPGNARLVALQKDGRILAGGAVSPSGGRIAAVLRYHQ